MLIALVAGVVVGLLIGGLGGGGAVLTLPVLVYAVGKDPHEATTASLVRPCARESTPSPPPRVSPPAPTVGQLPVGIERPRAASADFTG